MFLQLCTVPFVGIKIDVANWELYCAVQPLYIEFKSLKLQLVITIIIFFSAPKF